MGEAAVTRTRMSAEDRRHQIIEVSTHLFSEHGFERVTMSMIAGECGVTDPALYRHFESKDSLYEAVLVSLKNRINLEEIINDLRRFDDPERLLYGVASFIVKRFSKNKELSRLLLLSALEGHPMAKQTFHDLRLPFVDLVSEKLAQFKEAGMIRDVHPEITARCFIGMTMDCSLGSHLWRDLQGRSYDPDSIIQNNIPIYLKGLAPE